MTLRAGPSNSRKTSLSKAPVTVAHDLQLARSSTLVPSRPNGTMCSFVSPSSDPQ